MELILFVGLPLAVILLASTYLVAHIFELVVGGKRD